MKFKPVAGLTGAIALAFAASIHCAAASDVKLPDTMIWSAYDVGSGGYTEASAIANAVQSKFDTRVRVLPSGTSIGRLLPLQTEKAKFGFLSNETFFAAEGIYEFSDPNWGPQDLRVVLGRPAAVGIIAAADVGAKTVADLRGKRVGFVRGNPSLNIKTDAYLAFGGLARKDVQEIWFGSYGALKDAVLSGHLDAMGMVPTSSFAREIEASPRGMTWFNFSPDDEKGWKAATDVISFAEPVKQTVGAGISSDKPVWLLGYRYPMLVTYATTTEDEVYNLAKAIDESFELFKDASSEAKNWEVARSILPPGDAPMHDGAIRYAKEKGYWTDAAQAWQDARLKRMAAVKVAWTDARSAFAKTGRAEGDWPDFWDEFRGQAFAK